MNILSKRLKELRAEKKISQTQLATLVGISRTAYANYEQGTREPSIDVIILLCNFFDVPADYLIGRTDNY